jgi:inosine/xanthosine triphosphate pyrophosphatase family protein
MVNRYPLVLDTTDGNKIKELPVGDNLNLRDTSIVNVQNINALGIIDSPDIRVNGQRIVAQDLLDLVDVPDAYIANTYVKVNATGDGIVFEEFGQEAEFSVNDLIVNGWLYPSTDGTQNLGKASAKFNNTYSNNFVGNLLATNGDLIVNAATGTIAYSKLSGAPTSLSEFTNDVGYITTADLTEDYVVQGDELVGSLQGDVKDINGSIMVDSVNSIIPLRFLQRRGATNGQALVWSDIEGQWAPTTLAGGSVSLGDFTFDGDTITTSTGDINLGNVYASSINVTGTGISLIESTTDISLTAGNRVKVDGGVPFRVDRLSQSTINAVVGQDGDIVYNTTENVLQTFSQGSWKSIGADDLTGDLKGSVFADDSTIMIDAVNNQAFIGNISIRGNVIDSLVGETEIRSPSNIVLYPENNIWIKAGTKLIFEGTVPDDFEAKLQATSITADRDILLPDESGTLATREYVDARIVAPKGDLTGSVFADDSSLLVDAISGTHYGAFVGDLVGSVFADDSTIMVDAVNTTLFANVLQLPPLSQEPARVEGSIAVANGTSWDPAGKGLGLSYPVYFNTAGWQALY